MFVIGFLSARTLLNEWKRSLSASVPSPIFLRSLLSPTPEEKKAVRINRAADERPGVISASGDEFGEPTASEENKGEVRGEDGGDRDANEGDDNPAGERRQKTKKKKTPCPDLPSPPRSRLGKLVQFYFRRLNPGVAGGRGMRN